MTTKALEPAKLKAVYNRAASRYDTQHFLLTAGSDRRGRQIVVEKTVSEGDLILDCGAGTGSTGLMAAEKTGKKGKVVFFDLSEGMLDIAKKRVTEAGFTDRVEFQSGDMVTLPFEDNSFDAVLSTYSMCPLYDPARGALELFRVVKPGGRIGIAHSTDPRAAWLKWLAGKVEDVVWLFPSISLGCRSVSVLPTLQQAGGKVVYSRHLGVPLWPFFIFVVEKPVNG